VFETEEVDQALSSIGDPYVRMCAAVIFRAILDCRVDPLYKCSCSTESKYHQAHRRIDATVKKQAIDFILGKELEFWIDIAGLNINVDILREALKPETDKRGTLTQIIQDNIFKNLKKDQIQVLPELAA
jgi:hypothetical protein